jgi:hypothetical protein
MNVTEKSIMFGLISFILVAVILPVTIIHIDKYKLLQKEVLFYKEGAEINKEVIDKMIYINNEYWKKEYEEAPDIHKESIQLKQKIWAQEHVDVINESRAKVRNIAFKEFLGITPDGEK